MEGEALLDNLSDLDGCLVAQSKFAVKWWCRKHKLDYSVPARLAYFIVKRKQFRKAVKSSPYDLPTSWVPVIPRPWDSEDAWRELVEWRHPRLDLNLLQLAIVLKSHYSLLLYLWHPAFLREENYQDESGRLVNHPLHLLLALRHCNEKIPIEALSLENIRAELLQEERTVDLTAARLQRHPPKTKRQGFFASRFKRLSSGDTKPDYPLVPFLRLNKLETELASLTLTGTVVPFRDDWIPNDVSTVLCIILRKLKEPQARVSTLELLWQVQSNLSHRGFSLEFLQELENDFRFYMSLYDEDVQLLFCQLYWAVKKEERWVVKDPKKLERSLVIGHAVDRGEPYLKVFKFIPTEHLNLIISQLRYHFENFRKFHRSSEPRFQEAADAMEDLQRERTLQDHCVLSILDAVNGDARKVWGLSELPEPLKQLFPVPFPCLQESRRTSSERPTRILTWRAERFGMGTMCAV